MAVDNDVQFSALEQSTHMLSTGIATGHTRVVTIAQAMTANLATALVASHQERYAESAQLVASVAQMVRSEISAASNARENLPFYFVSHPDISEAEQVDIAESMARVIDEFTELATRCETWVAAFEPEHTARLDPQRHAYTTTCDMHVQNPNAHLDGCCCCGCSEFDHIGAVIEDDAR